METPEKKMWESYLRERSSVKREQLVSSYAGLVRNVVRRFVQGEEKQERVLESGDLTQAGMMGLLDAIERYDPSRGVKFESYALPRIQGAIQDELRKIDWMSRSERKRLRAVDEVVQHLHATGGDAEKINEFARERSLSTDEYFELAGESDRDRQESRAATDAETLNNIPGDGSENPYEKTRRDELYNCLYAAVVDLPRRERLIITLHYYEGLKFNAIAKALKMSESRVSQVHATVLQQLKDKCADTL